VTTLELQTPEAAHAGHQSVVYSLLAQSLRYPSPGLHQAASSGQLAREIAAAIAGLPFSLSAPASLAVGSLAEMEQAHVELFELGGPAGPPAFIFEGEYGGGRLGVLEDVLRFYDHFGISPSFESESRDRPDHIANELEFMHILSFQEAAALERRSDPSAYRRAQREFLRFHLADFTRAIAGTTVPKGVPFYSSVAALADEFCRKHLQLLDAAR
jgi:DMSO reductase family type II enzyme chaperone